MLTKLDRRAEIAKEKPNEKFTSLVHLIDEEMLKQCHKELNGKKAVGVDEVTKAEYDKDLDENIKALLGKMKNQQYRPLPGIGIYFGIFLQAI
jgi:RNA-directed DNA polymerase